MDENVSVLPRLCIASGADRVRYRSHVNQAVFAQENGYDYRFDLGVNEGGLRWLSICCEPVGVWCGSSGDELVDDGLGVGVVVGEVDAC